jgi:hypothetical protein
MSWDTLLLLVGLGFAAVAVLGNISGKISPGKGGRIAAALVGAALIAGGLWYHNALHGFTVIDPAMAPVQAASGRCPVRVDLEGVVDARGSGDVIYYFDFSNGNASAPTRRILSKPRHNSCQVLGMYMTPWKTLGYVSTSLLQKTSPQRNRPGFR